MKMLKTLIVSVLLVAQVSAVSTSNTQKARLCESIRKLELNLGLLKKKSQLKVNTMSKIGTSIKNNKGKIALGVGLITLGVLAYQNPAFVTNVVSTAKNCFDSGLSKVANFLVGKKVEIAETMNAQKVAHVVAPITKSVGDMTSDIVRRKNAEFILSSLKSCSGTNTAPTAIQIDNFISGQNAMNKIVDYGFRYVGDMTSDVVRKSNIEYISSHLRDCSAPRQNLSFMDFTKHMLRIKRLF